MNFAQVNAVNIPEGKVTRILRGDTVLWGITLGEGNYGYRITVLYPGGAPASGLSVTGLTDINGNALVTDENGQCLGVSTGTSATIGITPPYADIQSKTGISIASTGAITETTVQLEVESAEYITITTSGEYHLSPIVKSYDLCGVGGGGGGGVNTTTNDYCPPSTGGGGGYVTNALNLSADSLADRTLFVEIGSGGATGTNGKATTVYNGSSDGDVIVTANGGNAGYTPRSVLNTTIPGGTGNGNGGSSSMTSTSSSKTATGSNGGDGIGNIFEDASLGLAGGGGGATGQAWYATDATGYSVTTVYSGGAPYGANTNASPEGLGGGGSGGSKYAQYAIHNPTAGSAGCVYLRCHYEKGVTAWKKYSAVSTTVYAWDKYNAVGTTRYNYTTQSFSGQYYSYNQFANQMYSSFNPSTWTYSGQINCAGSENSGKAVGKYAVLMDIGYVDYLSSGNTDDGYSGTRYFQGSTYVSYSKGTTSYGQVTATSPGAYPNGARHSDGYWYVSAGSAVEYSQGDFVGDVTSADPEAYPENGLHTDGYWYVKEGA